MRRIAVIPVVAALAGWSLLLPAGSVGATAPPGPRLLTQAVPGVVQYHQARYLGRFNQQKKLSVALMFNLRNPALAAKIDIELGTPGSPRYGRPLTQAQADRLIYPTAAEQSKVVRWLRSNGLRITFTIGDHIMVAAAGPVSDFERAFHTTIGSYILRTPQGTRRFYSPATAPKLPASVSSIVHATIGLDNFTQYHTDLALPRGEKLLTRPHGAIRPAGAGPAGENYFPSDFQAEYDSSTLNGTGMHIAVIMWCLPPDGTALANWHSLTGDTAPTVNVTLVGGTDSNATADNVESDLDVESESGMAQGAVIDYFEAHSTGDCASNPEAGGDGTTLAEAETDAGATSGSSIDRFISNSWGGCDDSSNPGFGMDSTFEGAVATGHNYFFSSGDNGSWCGGVDPLATAPDTSIWVTAVGATAFGGGNGNTPPATISTNYQTPEAAWYYCNNCDGGNPEGSGGGYSVSENRPSWQTELGSYNAGDPANHVAEGGCADAGTTGCRGVPDIAGPGDPGFAGEAVCTNNGGCGDVGGTSEASPVMAGIFTAIDNAFIADTVDNPTGKAIGFLDPTLYKLANIPADYASDFHDVNPACISVDNGCTNGTYNTSTSWDPVTGLGSIDAGHMLTTMEANVVTATPVSHLRIRVARGWSTITWRSTHKFAGFDVFSGKTRLNHALVTSRTMRYRFRVHRVVRDVSFFAVPLG